MALACLWVKKGPVALFWGLGCRVPGSMPLWISIGSRCCWESYRHARMPPACAQPMISHGRTARVWGTLPQSGEHAADLDPSDTIGCHRCPRIDLEVGSNACLCLYLWGWEEGRCQVITARMADESMEAARARMIAKRFGGAENVRTGGKGSVRRKRKAQHKASSSGKISCSCISCGCR